MADRTSTVLHVLAAARHLGEPPVGRTAIVKMVYVCEMLRPSYELWLRSFEFERYHYGPYSDDILRRLDYLVFHQLVDVAAYTRQGASVRAQYVVNDAGAALAKQITASCGSLPQLAEDVIWSLQILGIRTAKELCALVYSEPFFAKLLRESEQSQADGSLSTELPDATSPSHPSFQLQSILKSLPAARDSTVTPRQLVRNYLTYLWVQAQRTSRGATSDVEDRS